MQQLQLADNLNKNASDWMYNIRAGEFGMKIKEAKRLSRLAKKKVSISGEPRKSEPLNFGKGEIYQRIPL